MENTTRKITPLWNPAIGLAADLTDQEWARVFKNINVQLYAQMLQEFRDLYCGKDGSWATEIDAFWQDMQKVKMYEREFVKAVYDMRGVIRLGVGECI